MRDGLRGTKFSWGQEIHSNRLFVVTHSHCSIRFQAEPISDFSPYFIPIPIQINSTSSLFFFNPYLKLLFSILFSTRTRSTHHTTTMTYPDLGPSAYHHILMAVRPHTHPHPHLDPYRSLPCTPAPLGIDPRNLTAVDLAPALNQARMALLEAPDYFSVNPRYASCARDASYLYAHRHEIDGDASGINGGDRNVLASVICKFVILLPFCLSLSFLPPIYFPL